MALTENPIYIHEPTDLQCGQAVLAMLSDKTVDEITGTDRETDLKQMLSALDFYGIKYIRERKSTKKKEDLPPVAILSLETPRCWHWSLYFKGRFLDPEHGVLEDFPESARKYYWEIII